jgi:hypothetical protein
MGAAGDRVREEGRAVGIPAANPPARQASGRHFAFEREGPWPPTDRFEAVFAGDLDPQC